MTGAIAHPFDSTQLMILDIVTKALEFHFKGRTMPVPLNKLKIRKRVFNYRKFIGGEAAAAGQRNHSFYEEPIANGLNNAKSNWQHPVLPAETFLLLFGFQVQTATGAA